MPRTEVYQDKAGEYRWRLLADNGEPIASSEGYTREADAERGLETAIEAMTTLNEESEGGEAA